MLNCELCKFHYEVELLFGLLPRITGVFRNNAEEKLELNLCEAI